MDGYVSSSESSWPDEMWFDPIRDHVRRRTKRSGGESTYGGSSVSGSSVDQMRQDIRNLRFYINNSDESRSATPVPTKKQRQDHIREERRWARLYQVLNEEVQRKLISLRLKINAMTDVARLPTEILCQIFIMVASDSSHRSHVPILTLTQVCRHWRKVAIALPMLWTSIYPSMTVRDLARSLRRSNGLPLDFTISGIQGTAEHWEHFHEHIGRCQKITIKEIPIQWIADLQPWLDNPAPLLEELVLSAVPSQIPISSDLDLSFFDQATPRLWRVRLDTIILPRSSFHLLLNITHLEFAFGHGPQIGCQIPSHRYILDLLSCAPLLEDALIERYGTEHLPYFKTYPPDYTPPRVPLNHLRRLCVQGMAPIELIWMEQLEIPLSCCVKIGIDMSHQQNLAPLLALIENPSKGLRPLLRVQETMFTGSTGSTSDKDKLGVHLWDPESQLVFAIVFRSPQSREHTELVIWMMSMTLFKRYTPRCLAWSNLTTRFVIGPGIYIRILIDRSTITDLAFDDCDFVTDTLQVLIASERTTSSPTGSSNDTEQLLCPNLAYLALSRCQALPGSTVLDLVRGRDIRGRTLKKLRIKDCPYISRRTVMDMRWLVDEIEWDGQPDWDGFSTMADLDPDEVGLEWEWEDRTEFTGAYEDGSTVAFTEEPAELDLEPPDVEVVVRPQPQSRSQKSLSPQEPQPQPHRGREKESSPPPPLVLSSRPLSRRYSSGYREANRSSELITAQQGTPRTRTSVPIVPPRRSSSTYRASLDSGRGRETPRPSTLDRERESSNKNIVNDGG
ncbi:hypothetical protein FRC19_006539 [Serendipita sp. 401]|nr:hypothetical protein FRC19_006539 [Serendipita sp. 401]KAG9058083.1 hypothetical protein FS842_001664 [Serendipita sp. 407]